MKKAIAYAQACARADAARTRMLASAEDAKARVAPARLKQDATSAFTGAVLGGIAKGAAQAQQRPIAIGAAATAFILYLARRPLAALFGRLYVRVKDAQQTISETDNG
jgi:hypothetical protein